MKKILLIEDEKLTREMYIKKLKDEGFQIFEAITTAEAEKILAKEKIDLIILDILLPKENGLTYLKRVQKNGEKTPPVIILSNLEGKEFRERAKGFGAKNYFLKTDYTPRELMKLIKKYLQ